MKKDFLFQASHFADVKANWGINFAIFSNNQSENVSDFNFELVDINTDNFELEVQSVKDVYNVDVTLKASDWVRQETKGLKTFDIPCVSSALTVKDSIKSIGKSAENSLGYFL